MADRPFTLLSCGVSLDGYLDSPTTKPLTLSNEADFERVDALRAGSDAILVGAAAMPSDHQLAPPTANRPSRGPKGAEPAAPAPKPTPRPEPIVGLDGIRGLAALFVVLNHIFERAWPGYPADPAPFWRPG